MEIRLGKINTKTYDIMQNEINATEDPSKHLDSAEETMASASS